MPIRIVDTSVMAAYCFREPRHEEAWHLLNGAELHAPVLLAYELTSVAHRKTIEQPEKSETFRAALALALAIPVRFEDIDHSVVFTLADLAGISTYDASYLYLAVKMNAELITFDKELSRAAGLLNLS